MEAVSQLAALAFSGWSDATNFGQGVPPGPALQPTALHGDFPLLCNGSG